MRARIVALVGATSSLVLVAFLVPLAILVRSSTADRALGGAVVEAQAMAPTVAQESGDALTQAVRDANAHSAHLMTVFLPDGQVVGAPAPRSAAVSLGSDGQSLTASTDGGREVIVAVAGLADGTAVIRTFVPDSELTAGVSRTWLVLGLLGLGLLVVSLLVADLLARLLTRPLTAVAGVAVRLAGGALGARADVEGAAEVRQVSAGLNLLAGRITELLAQERATVADLSHRLRTPLTVLRIDVDSVPEPELRARLIADLDGVDRTLDDVIRDAERPGRTMVAAECDAAAVVAERVQFWSVVADEDRREVTIAVDPPHSPVPVRLSRDELAACLDALIGNVFAHTEAGTPFAVRLTSRLAGGAHLVVADDGPGMPAGPVLSRGASLGSSTGLGLDIVSKAASRSGGGVTIGRGEFGGSEVVVELGSPEPPIVRSHHR